MNNVRRVIGLGLAIGVLAMPAWVHAQSQEPPRAATTSGALNTPGFVAFDESLLSRIRVPAGFRVNVFARPQGNARWMAVNSNGDVYLTRQKEGDVLLLRDTNGDGVADILPVVAQNLELVHGITIYNTSVYMISPTKVWVAGINGDGTLGAPQQIIGDLPDGGQHRARTIAVGSDGKLYMGVGSTCNVCAETNKENATMLRANLDGSNREIFAAGLRHTIGFAWHPQTGELWGMDMGSDWRGDNAPPDELNRIVAGANYGWPFCYGNKQIDRLLSSAPQDTTREAFCAASIAPALSYTAHSSPIGFAFYTANQFPPAYNGSAFVAFRGSWNRTQPSGYKVARLIFENGQPARFEDFMTGFVFRDSNGWQQFARLTGVAIASDGALLVADDSNGVIYRISYAGS